MTLTLLGARVGIAAGFGLTAAELAGAFAPLGRQAVTFSSVGGTSMAIFWWIGGRMVRTKRQEKVKTESTPFAATSSAQQMIPYRYYYHSDLLRLATTIFDWTDRMYFWHSVVDNAYLHLVTPDGQLVLRIRATSENADYTQILDLEKASGFTCAEVSPLPADLVARSVSTSGFADHL